MWVRSFNSFKSKFLDGLKSAKINCPSDCSCNLICLTNSTCVGCLKRKPQNEAFSEPGKSHYDNRERGEAVLFLFSFLHHHLLCVLCCWEGMKFFFGWAPPPGRHVIYGWQKWLCSLLRLLTQPRHRYDCIELPCSQPKTPTVPGQQCPQNLAALSIKDFS